jgi:hypothetical protein
MKKKREKASTPNQTQTQNANMNPAPPADQGNTTPTMEMHALAATPIFQESRTNNLNMVPFTNTGTRSLLPLGGLDASEMPILPERQNFSPNVPKTQASSPTLSSHVYHVQLRGGVVVEYTDDDFVDPPVLCNLISTPGLMFSIWDDESPKWTASSPLIIRSHSIPVKYWSIFYKSFKGRSRVWGGIKQGWSSWKVLLLSLIVIMTWLQFIVIRF